MRLFRYAGMVLAGACSLGVLSTIMKLGIEDGFTVGELLNSQYFFGFILMFVFVPFFATRRLSVRS